MSERSNECPGCGEPIPFRTVFLAPCPPRIRCPHCRAKLTGDRVVWRVTIVVCLLAAAVAAPVALWVRPWPRVALILALVVAATALPAALLTRWTLNRGSYRLR